MSIRRVVPDIGTQHMNESRAFYTALLGFEVAMDMGWIVTLVAPGERRIQLSLISRDESAPVVPDVSIEVDDVDAAWAAAQARGDEIVLPLTDEPWGVRRFFVRDPGGKVINIVMHAQR